MKKNMMPIDRILRIVLAVIIGILYLADKITGFAAVVLGIFAVIFAITSFIGFCPLYLFLPKKSKDK